MPFFLNFDEILQQIENSKTVFIRSVVSKVNANNFASENNELVCEVGDLLPGFSSSVVLDSFGGFERDLDDLHRVIRNICVGV